MCATILRKAIVSSRARRGRAGTVVKWVEHDPSTVYVLIDYQRPSSEPKLRPISELTIVSATMRRSHDR